MTVFCAVSPIGIGIGMSLSDPSQQDSANGAALVVVQGIATGSLLYVVFFEILEKERQKEVTGILQVLGVSIGFIFMVLLGLAEIRGSAEDEETLVEQIS